MVYEGEVIQTGDDRWWWEGECICIQTRANQKKKTQEIIKEQNRMYYFLEKCKNNY